MGIKEADKLHKDGIKLFRREKPEAAIEKFTQALEATDGDARKSAEIYNDIGVAYRDMKDYPAAYNALDEAMSRFTELGDKKGQAQTLGNRGAVLQAQGEMEKAVEIRGGFMPVGGFIPVWVTGEMTVKAATKNLYLVDGSADIDVGYSLQASHVEPYKTH